MKKSATDEITAFAARQSNPGCKPEARYMPGKHWTRDERRSLRQQIAAGVAPRDIVIENRSWPSICYMLRVLRIRWSNRWTQGQTRSLIAQIRQGNKLPDLRIVNKTPAAINAKRGHLRIAGKLKNQPARTKQKYSQAELDLLEHYAWQLGWSASQVHTAGVLPNRSYHSISKKMGRLGYGDPVRVQRARQARRLSQDEHNCLTKFLLTQGRYLSSEAIAQRFNISMKVVNFYRRKVGVSPSWHESRALSSTDEKRQRVAEAKRKHLKERWAMYRAKKTETLLESQQRLERMNYRAPIRTCRACAYPWFALPQFFSIQRRKLPNRVKVSMAQTCRICKMKLKQEVKAEESAARAVD
jgi:transcriptional regulator with XRE-family HTH domain